MRQMNREEIAGIAQELEDFMLPAEERKKQTAARKAGQQPFVYEKTQEPQSDRQEEQTEDTSGCPEDNAPVCPEMASSEADSCREALSGRAADFSRSENGNVPDSVLIPAVPSPAGAGAAAQAPRDESLHGFALRPRDGLLASFLIPCLVLLVIFAARRIYPFGEQTFLRSDMYHQYAPFFSEFRYKLENGGSLLYSWNVGMGVNFAALYAYYLASPFNWLLFLCPAGLVLEFMTGSIVIKTGLCGLSMAWYLGQHNRSRGFETALFGICYALSGYMAAYSWNLMWLDCIWLFPLVAAGLERLVKKGDGLGYCLALGLSILSNYYISIMVCLFMVVYFAALLILEDSWNQRRLAAAILRFAVYSLLAGGLAAAVLLPEIYALKLTVSGEFHFPTVLSQYFSIFDILARHLGNVASEIGLDHWPNIYCGVAVLVLFVLYLADERIRAKEKAVYCALLFFLLASFSINVLNFVWHGFHYPNSLPCRQSFIYIFLVLVVCHRACMDMASLRWKTVAGAFAAAVVFVLLAQKFVESEQFHFSVFYAAILFLSLYLGLMRLYRRGGRFRTIAMLLALAAVTVETAVNMSVTSVTTTSRTAYLADNEDVQTLVDSLLPADSFFRVEKVSRKTKNDGAWLHFPSVSLFSSVANADLSDLFKVLGCESSVNAYSITGSTPLIDMLFSVRYALFSEEAGEPDLRTLLAREGDTYLYENLYSLPMGFMVPSDFEERWDRETGGPADVQNSLADCLSADHVLATMLSTTLNGQTASCTADESGEYYAYVQNQKVKKVQVTTSKGTQTFSNVDRGFLLELGCLAAGEEITIQAVETSEKLWVDVYRFNEEGLAGIYEALSASGLVLSSWTDTGLSGTINCAESGLLFLTIPWDEGWTIMVDDIEQPAQKLLNAFISVRLTPGVHTVSMRYEPPGRRAGLLITLGSIAALVLLTVLKRRSAAAGQRSGSDSAAMNTGGGI